MISSFFSLLFVTPVIKKFFREHYYQVTSDQKRVDAESHRPGPEVRTYGQAPYTLYWVGED